MENIKEDKMDGEFTKSIKKETSKLPSGHFLSAAIPSMGASLSFKLLNNQKSTVCRAVGSNHSVIRNLQ